MRIQMLAQMLPLLLMPRRESANYSLYAQGQTCTVSPRNGSRSLSITGKMDAQVEEELELAVLLARMLTRMLAYRLKSIRVDSKQAPLQDIEWIRAIAGFIGQIHMCANNISFPVSLFENKQHIVTRAQDQGVGYRYLALLGLPRRGSGSFSSQSSSG